MAIPTILVVGAVSTGKTTSIVPLPELGIEGLSPEKTVYINVAGQGKIIPIANWRKLYNVDKKLKDGGNYSVQPNPRDIRNIISLIDKSRPDVKFLVVDDFDYTMGKQVMGEDDLEWEDWRKIGVSSYGVLKEAVDTPHRDDLCIIIMMHSDLNEEGEFEPKTAGKMISKYISLAGLFSYVFYSRVTLDPLTGEHKYTFITNRTGNIPAKTPYGAFTERYIPNDMGNIVRSICAFEGIDVEAFL